MPATLDQAFQSPFHRTMNASASSGTASIRNPDYYSFQNDFHVKSAMDIESEADDLKNIYGNPVSRTKPIRSESALYRDSTAKDGDSHDCTLLIAKILACPRCRRRVKELLANDVDVDADVATSAHDDHVAAPRQSGGAIGLNFGDMDFRAILVNIILGILLILLVDFVLRG